MLAAAGKDASASTDSVELESEVTVPARPPDCPEETIARRRIRAVTQPSRLRVESNADRTLRCQRAPLVERMHLPMELILKIWLVLAVAALLEALYSLREGIRFRSFLRRGGPSADQGFRPPASVIVPCRGLDPGFEENIRAFCSQDHEDFQLLFVTSDAEDPSALFLAGACPERSRLIFAGQAKGRGQKVHNLRFAVKSMRAEDEVIVFGDSDIRPHPQWLCDLVATLANPEAGLATGFRWYLPQKGNFASRLRSVWNAGIVSLLGPGDNFFAWGGAMAIRRGVFDSCRVDSYWESALSDDFAISRAVHEHGKRILFQPRALSFSHEDCTLREFLDWSFRQMAITRVYHPRLWALSFVGQSLNVGALWGGLFLALLASSGGGLGMGSISAMLVLIATIYILGCLKAWLRLDAVVGAFPERAGEILHHRRAYFFWGPLASMASLLALLRSSFQREIEWRGIRYRLVSPTRTEIVKSESESGSES